MCHPGESLRDATSGDSDVFDRPASDKSRELVIWTTGQAGLSSLSLGGFVVMPQAPILNCVSFDLFSGRIVFAALEVDIGRR
jgi:hypothetical protein